MRVSRDTRIHWLTKNREAFEQAMSGPRSEKLALITKMKLKGLFSISYHNSDILRSLEGYYFATPSDDKCVVCGKRHFRSGDKCVKCEKRRA